MNDEDNMQSPWAPGQYDSEEQAKALSIPMGVFLRSGSTLCILMLTALYVICWQLTDGSFPAGIKLYAIFGIIFILIVIRLVAGGSRRNDHARMQLRISGLQALIVAASGVIAGIFLTWFFRR